MRALVVMLVFMGLICVLLSYVMDEGKKIKAAQETQAYQRECLLNGIDVQPTNKGEMAK